MKTFALVTCAFPRGVVCSIHFTRMARQEAGTIMLIELVRDTRVLWDTHSDEYHKRDKRTLA